MTHEEAAYILDPETSREALRPYLYDPERRIMVVEEARRVAVAALRPVSREQVEGIRGEWVFPIFADQEDANDPRWQCSECGSIEIPLARHRFCPSCGAPMTDEAVQMVMERLEALKDGDLE